MVAKTLLGIACMMFLLVQTGNASGKEDLQNYFNNTACNVKATADPVQKRVILTESLRVMSEALDTVERSGLVSRDDLVGVDRFKTALHENRDELAGAAGYARVSDAQLDTFSNYIVQSMEQADQSITISLVSVLLLVIIMILIL